MNVRSRLFAVLSVATMAFVCCLASVDGSTAGATTTGPTWVAVPDPRVPKLRNYDSK